MGNKIGTASEWTAVNPVLRAGQIGVEKDTSKFKIGNGTSTWSQLAYFVSGGTGAVSSVAGRTGAVVLTKTDVGLANVDNTADSAKPVSTAQQTALNAKANTASPTFTGTVSGVTAAMVGALANTTGNANARNVISFRSTAASDARPTTDTANTTVDWMCVGYSTKPTNFVDAADRWFPPAT